MQRHFNLLPRSITPLLFPPIKIELRVPLAAAVTGTVSQASQPRSEMRWSRSKWAATAASIWIQCTSGSSYCFGIYSPVLKSSQRYSQSTLDSVAFFKDVGANVGVLSGLLYSATSAGTSGADGRAGSRWRGPWITHAVGAVQCFVGYLFMWLSVTGALPRPPVPLMCLYMFLAAHAQTFFNTADVVTAVQNFPESRGTAVGIMKGFLGLSGAILIEVYRTVYAGEPSNFILMLVVVPTLFPLLLMSFVEVHHTSAKNEMEHLNGLSIISLAVAAYLMILIIWENILPIESIARVVTFVILLLLVGSPLYIVMKAHRRVSSVSPKAFSNERILLMGDCDSLEADEQRRPVSVNVDACLEHNNVSCDQTSAEPDRDVQPRKENLSILQAMGTVDFWLLFVAMACGMGSGLATVNNISQIGGALEYTPVEISTMVSLWSIWNFLGRFGAGYTSDYFLNSRGYARPVFIALTLAIMSIGHLVIASGLPGALYFGSVLVGVCYGCQWSLMPTVTSELFGVMHMGTIFNTISIASPLGSYILSVRVVGYIYDMEASSSGMKTCIGVHCFRISFLIMAAVSLFGFLVASVLFFRTRKFYEHVVVKWLRHASAA